MDPESLETTRTNLERLTRILSEAFRPGELSPAAKSLVIRTIRLLARGVQVPRAQLAGQREALEELEAVATLELDDEARIVGLAGLSIVPTAHSFRVAGRDLYAWCALDTLFLPALLGAPASVQSTCPIAGARIRLDVTPSGVARVDPPRAMLGVVIPGVTPGVKRLCGPETCGPERTPDPRDLGGRHGAFCTRVHFLSSGEAATRWLAENPGAVVLGIQKAYELGRDAFIRPMQAHL